jgi:ABC-type phosphate transport system substrate-binding protein
MKSFETPIMPSTFLKYFSVAVLVLFLSVGSFAQEALTVIGNSKGSPAELKMMQLQSILKGEKQRWGDGTKVVIALMKTNTPVGNVTSKRIFNMSGDQLNKYWLALVFQGKADAPTFFNSMNELETFVAQTPGAIGIIGQPPTIAPKTILVDGKRFL